MFNISVSVDGVGRLHLDVRGLRAAQRKSVLHGQPVWVVESIGSNNLGGLLWIHATEFCFAGVDARLVRISVVVHEHAIRLLAKVIGTPAFYLLGKSSIVQV